MFPDGTSSTPFISTPLAADVDLSALSLEADNLDAPSSLEDLLIVYGSESEGEEDEEDATSTPLFSIIGAVDGVCDEVDSETFSP